MMRFALAVLLAVFPTGAAEREYRRRVETVRSTPGFVALWDFVLREAVPGGQGRFAAHQPRGRSHDFHLNAVNYVRDYWNSGRPATYDDFPLLGHGPFGQAVGFRAETDPDFRPCLMVPRARLHDTPLDVKGPGRSGSMVVWLLREAGNHAIAGIWHEGTDLKDVGTVARRVEAGRRQYALFAGLAANPGAAAVHVSENGSSSFGDKYARNLAVTPEVIPAVAAGAPEETLRRSWSAVGFVFDNRRDIVTAYLNGHAGEFWIENPDRHPFYQWPARGWREGSYRPPEGKPLARTVLSVSGATRVELHQFPFTRVRVTFERDSRGKWEPVRRELVALRANPYWFPHDLFTPPDAATGGPFTIGRVIHMGRSNGFVGYIGGVAVFSEALSPRHMRRLAAFARQPIP